MLYPVLEVFLYSVDLFPMLSAVSCLYFFHSCYFCILNLSLLTFLIFVFASFYFLLFFILSSYLFLFFHSSIRSLIFLCILSVFIHYCIFFNLRFIILSFFVHLKIIFLKFSAHIDCLSWVFVFLHYISSITSLSPVLYSFSVS